MFETLNYLVELTVSIYFLCIFILFVVNVCEFMPRVDHSAYKDDEDYQPLKAKVVKDKSTSGVSIHEHRGIQTKSGTKRGGSSQKVIKADSGKIEKESRKPTQSSSKSLVGKSKQGSKTKVEAPDEAAESTDEDAKPSEEEATTDEEDIPVGNTEEGVQEDTEVEAKLLSKSSVKSSGSKKSGQGGLVASNVSEEKEHTERVRDENDDGPTEENVSTGETVEEIKASVSKRKSENLSKSSVKRVSISVDPKKSESQTFNEANTQGGGTTAEEGQGAEQEGPETEQEGVTDEQEAEISSDIQNDPIKKPSKSPEEEVASTELDDNPPPE